MADPSASAAPAAPAASSANIGKGSKPEVAAEAALKNASVNPQPNASKAAIQARVTAAINKNTASIVVVEQNPDGNGFIADVAKASTAVAPSKNSAADAPSSSSSSADAEVKPAGPPQSAGRRRKRRGCTRRKKRNGGKRSQRRKQSRRRR
jgi:hypothetical protein